MKGEYRQPNVGEVFYYGRDKMHYIGCASSTEDKVHVFWCWNKWKSRRYYMTFQDEVLQYLWKFFTKKRQH